MKNDESIECDGEVSVEMKNQTYDNKEDTYKNDLLKESSNDEKDNNADNYETTRMLIKAEKDFKDKINEVKLIKMKLLDQLKTLEEERKAMDEKRHNFITECETYEAKKNAEKTVQKEEEKELVIIQEAAQRHVEVLLGSMMESAFELATVLEETE